MNNVVYEIQFVTLNIADKILVLNLRYLAQVFASYLINTCFNICIELLSRDLYTNCF